ncbi:hypothetical protein E8E14_007842 [Neopestalotiopsis sp. 37M]|nr:hypothetical protein E8E14_007842 [Neopestalotiopsis sp. 37M]
MPPRENKAPRAKADTAGTIENIRLVRTGVLCNGELATYGKAKSHNPRNNAPTLLPDDLDEVSDALFALNDLQLRRHAPVHALSLAYTLQSLLHAAPESVQSKVAILGPTLSDELFGDSYQDSESLISTKSRTAGSKRTRGLWGRIRQKEFVFWPVQTDAGIWSTIILHLGISEHGVDFDKVAEFAVVDASHGPEAQIRITCVVSRLRQFFCGGDVDWRPARQHEIWVPPQLEEWESGIRCFELIRQLLRRVTDVSCSNQSFDWDRDFSPPTSGWLNVDFIRHEMMGMALERCNTILNYSCRYALEPILEVRLEEDINLSPDCLAPLNDTYAYIPGTEVTASHEEQIFNNGGGSSKVSSENMSFDHTETIGAMGAVDFFSDEDKPELKRVERMRN